MESSGQEKGDREIDQRGAGAVFPEVELGGQKFRWGNEHLLFY